RDEHGIDLRVLLQQFQCVCPDAGNQLRDVCRVNERLAMLCRVDLAGVVGRVEIGPGGDHLRAEPLHGLDLERVGSFRHEDRGLDAEQACCVGDGLTMVPGRCADDTSRALLIRHLTEQVDSSANLERADRLQVLAFDDDPASHALGQGRGLDCRRRLQVVANHCPGAIDVGKCWQGAGPGEGSRVGDRHGMLLGLVRRKRIPYDPRLPIAGPASFPPFSSYRCPDSRRKRLLFGKNCAIKPKSVHYRSARNRGAGCAGTVSEQGSIGLRYRRCPLYLKRTTQTMQASPKSLLSAYRAGELTRRSFISRATAAGLSLGAATFLANGGNPLAAQTPASPAASPTAGTAERPTVGTEGLERGSQGELRILWWQAPTVLIPHLGADAGYQFVMEPMLHYFPDDSIQPILLSETPSVENGLLAEDLSEVTLKLREGLVWSD